MRSHYALPANTLLDRYDPARSIGRPVQVYPPGQNKSIDVLLRYIALMEERVAAPRQLFERAVEEVYGEEIFRA